MEMERFKHRAGEEDLGVVALVLDMAKAFERVSLPVAWAWATHLSLPRKILLVHCGHFEHQRRVQFEGCLAGHKWSCLLQRIVVQDALSEVTKIDPPLKLRVFVDDITALLMKRNKKVVEMAKKVMRKSKKRKFKNRAKNSRSRRMERKERVTLLLSVGFWEEKLRECSEEEGVVLVDSVETLGADLRTKGKR